jgi:hypothetical protein
MIRNDLRSKHEGEVNSLYEQPEVRETIVKVTDPLVHEQNGKKSHTTYRVSTIVCCCAVRHSNVVWLVC